MAKPVGPQDYFDLMQKMANPAGYPFQSLMFPAVDVKEVEKKIAELETVEHWLTANLGLLQLSIKSLQYQKALLAPSGEKSVAPAPAFDPAAMMPQGDKLQEALMNPAMWAWQLMNQAGAQVKQAAPKEHPKAVKSGTKRRGG